MDVASDVGLDFHHDNGMSGELYMVEMVGAGAALFDYDRDGDLDLYLVDGGSLHPGDLGGRVPGRLFRNELERGTLRFTDVTDRALPAIGAYGQGVATGDYDNDGWVDLYLTNYGPNLLLRNSGDGTFELHDSPRDSRWNTASAFFDYDRDGDLDLYVGAYIDATLDNHYKCTAYSGIHDYCGPKAFPELPDKLLENRGAAGFVDVSTQSGIAALPGATLGAVAADLNDDGWIDLYVANDQMENFLWINQGDGTFANQARIAGASVNAEGMAEASMGVEVADLNGDGLLDLFMTHLKNETNTLYAGRGQGVFADGTATAGLGPASLPYTSFGTRAFDVDNDSDLDLFIANGSVHRIQEQMEAGDRLALSQQNQLFLNRGNGSFEDRSHEVPALGRLRVSRGVATGDVDNDGDVDVVVTNNNGPVELLLNTIEDRSDWIGLDLRIPGDADGRPALGARAALTLADGREIVRSVQSSGSFLSAGDPRLTVGLSAAPTSLRIDWPDGRSSICDPPPVGEYSVLSPESETCSAK